jgi:hypothetical protein
MQVATLRDFVSVDAVTVLLQHPNVKKHVWTDTCQQCSNRANTTPIGICNVEVAFCEILLKVHFIICYTRTILKYVLLSVKNKESADGLNMRPQFRIQLIE